MYRQKFTGRRPEPLPDFITQHDWRGVLELHAEISVEELKAKRRATIEKIAPRPDYVRILIERIALDGGEGQVCPAEMQPRAEYAARGGVDLPKPQPGARELLGCWLYERSSAASRERGHVYLAGDLSSKKLNFILKQLQETCGGKLERVALIVRRTPRKNEPRPIWTLCIAVPEDTAPVAGEVVRKAARY